MVVHDFYVNGFPVLPDETDSVAVIDPDAVLACAIFPKSLELKARALQVVQRRRGVQDGELPIGYFGDGFEFPGPDAVEDLLGLGVFEAHDHASIVYCLPINSKVDVSALARELEPFLAKHVPGQN
jgi:hypothetical protein